MIDVYIDVCVCGSQFLAFLVLYDVYEERRWGYEVKRLKGG